MTSNAATVYVVDDDDSVRRATARLFRSAGLPVEAFESAEEFLATYRPNGPGCLILDLQMPGVSGIELQQSLTSHNIDLPVVFMTGQGDIPTTVTAMKSGAVDFLPKPVDDERLLEIVRQTIADHARRIAQDTELNAFRNRVNSLTRREHEVMLQVVTGKLNKQIARILGITETTVKVHRGRVMEKTQVESVAELVRLCERSGITTDTSD